MTLQRDRERERAYLDIGAALQQQPVLRVEQEDAEGPVQRTRAVHPLVAAPLGGGAHLPVLLVHQQAHLVQQQLLLAVQHGGRGTAERRGRPLRLTCQTHSRCNRPAGMVGRQTACES